jgi:predicted NBD/HSP70 family sugar kinase
MCDSTTFATALRSLPPEITAWDEVFVGFTDLPLPQRMDIVFKIDRGWGEDREYRVSVPRDVVNDSHALPIVYGYLAYFLYNRLVADGGKGIHVSSNYPERDGLIVEHLSHAFKTRLGRMPFYCNFGDPIPIYHGKVAMTSGAENRVPLALAFDPACGCALGIDIGGTSIKLAFVEKGQRVCQHLVPVDRCHGGQAIVNQVEALVIELMCHFSQQRAGKHPLDGIGVGVAGVLKGQQIVRATNFERHWAEERHLNVMPWELGPDLFPNDYAALNKLPMRLSSRFGVGTVALINDADAFGFQEVVCQPNGHIGTVVVLTLGTGVGYVKVVDGVIEDLPHQGGHMIVSLQQLVDSPNAPPRDPGCGHCGCLAAYASATALTQQLRRAFASAPLSVAVVNEVLASIKEVASWLAVAVAELAAIVPHLREVILAAGLVSGHTGELILRYTRGALYSRFPKVASKVQITLSKTEALWGGAVGAAQFANLLAQSASASALGRQQSFVPATSTLGRPRRVS